MDVARSWMLAVALSMAAPVPTALAAPVESPGTVRAEGPAVDAATAGPEGIVDLEALVVSGAQPGPGLWKVRKGGHTLFILGAVSPLPRRMEWTSTEVESVVASAGVVIAAPSLVVDADVGFFRGMALVPAALRARNNPDKRRLREVVSAEQYVRWEVLKARYLGRDRGVEKRRPLLAAHELYEAALDRSGLRAGGVVWPVVRKAAKAAGVPIVDASLRIKLQDPKAVLKDLAGSDLADRECFDGTMDRIETDLHAMRARANAWAVGDLDGLRALPWEDHYATCVEALTGSAVAANLGFEDVRGRMREIWLGRADDALDEHPVSFAVLPMQNLLADDGLLEALRARGYAIESP